MVKTPEQSGDAPLPATVPMTLDLPRGLYERTALAAIKQGRTHEQVLLRMIADGEAYDLVSEWRERNGDL